MRRGLKGISRLGWLLIAAALVLGVGGTAAGFTLTGGSDGGVVVADLSGGACPKNFDPLIGMDAGSPQFAQGYNRAYAACFGMVLSPMYGSSITSAAQVPVALAPECQQLDDLSGMEPYEFTGSPEYNAHAQNAAFELLRIAMQLFWDGCGETPKPKHVFVAGTYRQLLSRAVSDERAVFSNT